MADTATKSRLHDVVVIGAGAAGVGVAVTLRHAGIEDLMVLDRNTIGASFASWPEETRFITPSFPTNSIGMLDLNSVAIGTSPAATLGVEHPTGPDYAEYLQRLARFFELPIAERTDVLDVTIAGGEFHVHIAEGFVRAKHVVWAAGEFQYPRLNGIPGSEHCRHTATVPRYRDLDGDDFIVIGGYESGVDAAYHLAKRNKRVRLFDKDCPWRAKTTDPSVALSTYSGERMRDGDFLGRVQLHPNTRIAAVRKEGNGYVVGTVDGDRFDTPVPPLYAGGFEGSHRMVAHYFDTREDGYPFLSESDESTLVPGLFLCGPAVRHGNQSFCFIYKYRQRFAVVAKAIASSLDLPAEQLELYRTWGMYLDDLSCCGQECVC
ncbi:MAG: NAD(P)/FAD-dependent oxidoreductase [Actinomycetota bacterium]